MEKEITIAGKKIFYRLYGQGKPVMLVHGFGEMGDVWQNQVDALQDRFKLIVPDLPGSGRSEMIADMSMEGMAEIIKALIDKEASGSRSENISVIGHSMGGYVTLAFAEKYETMINSFGLFHSSAFPDSEEKKAARRKGIEFMRENGAFEFLKTSSPNLFSPKTKEENAGMVEDFIQSLRNFSAEASIAYYEAMINRPDRVSVLKNFKKDILFVIGEYDNAVPPADQLKQSHLPQVSHLHILHQSGHMGMMEEAGKSNQILEEFLAGV
ncbi:MAG TPA: alpha/beta hydrolase [Chitinophagaceae bacterium]|nr:alpha/beta hydrolase [Chitinophagaceae bacterium]